MSNLNEDLDALVAAWFKEASDRAWRLYESGDHARAVIPNGLDRDQAIEVRREILAGDAENRLGHLSDRFRAGDYLAGRPIAREILARIPGSFDEGDQRFAILAKRLVEALCEIENGRIEWANGNETYVPKLNETSSATLAVAAPETPSLPEAPSLDELAEAYLEHRQREKKTTGKGIQQLKAQIDILLDQLGAGSKISDVTPRFAGSVFTAFRSLPAGHKKIPVLSGLALFDAAKKSREDALIPMSPKSINNHMTTYRGLFNEAIQLGVIENNPFKGKQLPVLKQAGSDRGFTPAELERIFSLPTFHGCERLGRPFQPGEHLLNDRRFWLPLLALMTGARVSELCQLRAQDVKKDGAVWVMEVNHDEGKRTKTVQSVRSIPIHDELIRIGFLDYVASRPARGSPGSLFDIPIPTNGDWGSKMGNWFREKLCRNVFGEEARAGVGFHSFRHCAETSMRAAHVREDVAHRLLGHSPANVAAGYGRYEAKPAKEAIMAIQVPKSLCDIPTRVGA